MIRYLADHEKRRSESLYREAFPEDKDAFVNYYYTYVTKNNRILVEEQAGEVCSMLHLNPYDLGVNGQKVAAYYYVAVATKANCRHQGMMRSLLHQSLRDIYREGHPFTYLMPANRAIYEPFDFRIAYEQKKVELPLNPEEANEKLAELFEVYTLRDAWYVEKMLEEERVCAGDAPFDITPYIMMRITHVENMLGLLKGRESRKVILKVEDDIIPENNGSFLWEISESASLCRRLTEDAAETEEKISIRIADLTEFVFGKRQIKGLEDVKVLKKICINEAV